MMRRFTSFLLGNVNSLDGVRFPRLLSITCIVFFIMIFDLKYIYYEFRVCILYENLENFQLHLQNEVSIVQAMCQSIIAHPELAYSFAVGVLLYLLGAHKKSRMHQMYESVVARNCN